MQNKKCESIMNRYLELDKNEKVPFALTHHFLTCKHCQKNVRLLSQAEKIAPAPLTVKAPVTDSLIENIMKNLPEEAKSKARNPISVTKWIIAGIIMLIMMFVTILYANRFNNRDLLIAYALMIAGATICYCSAFVWCNLDFFVKKLNVKLAA